MGKIILTGDRPTGKLHLGHYVGTLLGRLEAQKSDEFDEIFIMIADAQALTDNAEKIEKVQDNVIEVAKDYLSIGLDPKKVTFFVQSKIPALTEITTYFMNLVTVSRVERNPTVKEEIKQKGFEKSIPVGFQCYPIAQAADIVAFNATDVPAGEDQEPMLELTREIVKKFNTLYSGHLKEPHINLPVNKVTYRLPGLDGNGKMSKSLNNAIYLSDDKETVEKKIMGAYTDPNHIKISDPGNTENNVVFKYLEAFSNNIDYALITSNKYSNFEDLKTKYEKGGVGDIETKKILISIINNLLTPIRERRNYFDKNEDLVWNYLIHGTRNANKIANDTLNQIKDSMGINYF